MNYVIAIAGMEITLGLISGITSTTNGIYSLADRLSKSEAEEVKHLIRESDMEMTVRVIQCIISEIQIDKYSPVTLNLCIKSIYQSIKEIESELEKIHYRLQYNDNLWVGKSVRGYGFQNCCKRLKEHLSCLNNRKKLLLETLAIKDTLYRNENLENMLTQSIYNLDKTSMDKSMIAKVAAKNTRNVLQYTPENI
jgi:hypothetical protein